MGNYNPHAPIILGQEWVPIRDEDTVFAPSVNAVELGHKFTLIGSQQVNNIRFYSRNNPAFLGQAMLAAVYPYTTEDLTGPISRVVIPCNNGGVTGTAFTLNTGSVAGDLFSPSDGTSISVNPTLSGTLSMFFNTNAYAAILAGKRILGVNLLYLANGLFGQSPNVRVHVLISNDAGHRAGFGILAGADAPLIPSAIPAVGSVQRKRFGEVAHFWQSQSVQTTSERVPWRYSELQQFEASAANRIFAVLDVLADPAATEVGTISYVALEVVYCEERRLITAGRVFGTPLLPTFAMTPYIEQTNVLPARLLTSLAANPILTAGPYTLTIASADVGDLDLATIDGLAVADTDYPSLNALRELYQILPHPGVQVDHPFPVEERLGDTFTQTETHVLTQLSVHASGGTLTEPHVYGRQGAAQVYGANTATQEIFNYNDIGLLLPGTAGNNATTPDNAALDIVGDIDLRADVAMSPAAWAGTVTFLAKWTSAGNQRSYLLDTSGTGFLRFFWSTTGANLLNFLSTAPVTPLIPPSGRLAVRATLDVDNGAAGHTVTFYTAPTIDGPWTQLGSPQVGGGVTSIFSSTAILEVGSFDAGTSDLLPGTMYADEVRSGIDGTAVANPRFDQQPPGTTVFVDAAGRTWTINGTAAIVSTATNGGIISASYPQVRYYARRFGDTSIPLTLTGVGSFSASTASITPSDFDLLPEIIDGWREVTLRFATPPTMGGSIPTPGWTWSATSETAGNRWEILAACAPAISGSAGTGLFNQVPFPDRLGPATYQPPVGSDIELTWMPQGVASPYVSGAVPDPACDAVLIFSQDPPIVSGLSLTQLTQTVTGIGLDCGSQPCCIPSGIGYQRITWTAVSFSASGLAASGFGAYELQRFDTTPGAGFETIMLATSPYVTGFNDYEARIGITSVYRIRSLNVLNFAGAWSPYVSGAPPGVTVGPCGDNTGALAFTSNAAQSGIHNAAYIMQWASGLPTEAFGLPEADMVQFQPMYNRDGSIAFHGTERGLEDFTRDVLLHAGAIDPIRLTDARTIRDLAWADLPYVCVRDERGDRWFANVRIPSVASQRNATQYMARLEITETTRTPHAVNP